MGEVHTLASNGNAKGIKKYLAGNGYKKAFLSLDDEKGWSPLHYASHYSRAKIVQLILTAGISPNIKSKALNKQKQNEWNLALEAGNKEKIPTFYPMDVAEGPNRTKIIEALIAKGGKFFGDELSLHQAVRCRI